MTLNKYLNLNNYFLILLLIFPLSMIIGQAAISINYFLIFITTIFLLFKKDFFKITKNYLIIFLPLFLIIFFSSIYNYYYLEYNNPIKSFLYFKNLFFILFIVYVFRNYQYLNLFFKLIFLLCLFVAVDNYIQYFFGYDIFGYQKSKYRLTGPFGDNEFVTGAYLSKFLILILPIYFFNNKNNLTLKSVFFLIFFFFSILITGERASIFAFVLGIIIFMLIYFKDIKKLSIIIFSIILITAISISFNKTIKYKFLQTSYQIGTLKYYSNFFDVPNSFEDYENRNFFDSKHGAHFLTAIQIWKNNKLIGIGPKNFSIECKKDKYKNINSKSYKSRCNTHPHNIYLELLSETGFAGLFMFFFIIFYILNRGYKFIITIKEPFIISSISQVITIIWPFTTSGSIISNFNGSFFWLNLGVLIALINIKKNEKK